MPQPADTDSPEHPDEPAALRVPPGLDRTTWQQAARRLLVKMLAEFAYEDIVRPVPEAAPEMRAGSGPESETDGGTGAEAESPTGSDTESEDAEDAETGVIRAYRLPVDSELTLRFRARRGAYGHWRIDPESLTPADADPLDLVARAPESLLGLSGDTTGHLLRELTATLTADVRLAAEALPAARLADLDYAELEGHQSGHPWLVLNKGRLGFSASDSARWAPEARTPQRLPWIAVRAGRAAYRGVPALADPERLYAAELGAETLGRFRHRLRARGLAPEEYLLLPVHPWQWDETIAPLYAASLASEEIVPVGADGDVRLPQQSIRTFLNTSRPDRHTVKLPLSILNTLVWRGLPTQRTLAAPAVTRWMCGLRDLDPYLSEECRIVLLGEVASVAVRHPQYDALPQVPYQYRELLGCIWREPLAGRLDAGERGRTLAALLHTDPAGRAFTAELVARSGLAPRAWLSRLFAALLPPLLHFLYQYGTVFSPHGENAVVIFDERDVPVRLAVKDFVDDVNVSARPLPELDAMPDEVRSVLLTEPPEFLTQFIHSGLFVGVFRYLAPLCDAQLGISERDFWSLVRTEIERYHARFPQLKNRFETFDMLTPRIDRLCLNRNRLHLDGYRDRSERPHAAVHGSVPNPLHRH